MKHVHRIFYASLHVFIYIVVFSITGCGTVVPGLSSSPTLTPVMALSIQNHIFFVVRADNDTAFDVSVERADLDAALSQSRLPSAAAIEPPLILTELDRALLPQILYDHDSALLKVKAMQSAYTLAKMRTGLSGAASEYANEHRELSLSVSGELRLYRDIGGSSCTDDIAWTWLGTVPYMHIN